MSSSCVRVLGEEPSSRFRLWAPSSPRWTRGGTQEDGCFLAAWREPWAAPSGSDKVSSRPGFRVCEVNLEKKRTDFLKSIIQNTRWTSDLQSQVHKKPFHNHLYNHIYSIFCAQFPKIFVKTETQTERRANLIGSTIGMERCKFNRGVTNLKCFNLKDLLISWSFIYLLWKCTWDVWKKEKHQKEDQFWVQLEAEIPQTRSTRLLHSKLTAGGE